MEVSLDSRGLVVPIIIVSQELHSQVQGVIIDLTLLVMSSSLYVSIL